MRSPIHRDRVQDIRDRLEKYERERGLLLGLTQPSRRNVFILQIISSLRRIEYIRQSRTRYISPDRCNPLHAMFDPLKAAALLGARGEMDEAVWMVFVATHFGKHVIDKWRLAANVCGSFGAGPVWTKALFGQNAGDFRVMLTRNEARLRDPGQSGRYSNHRQYQSKHPDHIYRVFSDFYGWAYSNISFSVLIRQMHESVGQEPLSGFRYLYNDMDKTSGFGRLGKFDFLTMISKLDLAPIEADSVHLVGATGPLRGAKLLLFGESEQQIAAAKLEKIVDELDDYLMVGKQVIEDSICNWQKNPDVYVYFRG